MEGDDEYEFEQLCNREAATAVAGKRDRDYDDEEDYPSPGLSHVDIEGDDPAAAAAENGNQSDENSEYDAPEIDGFESPEQDIDGFMDTEEVEPTVSTDTLTGKPMAHWMLGKGILAVPPNDASAFSVHSDWSRWDTDNNGKYRAVRHMTMQIPNDFRNGKNRTLISGKSFSDRDKNERMASFLALQTLMQNYRTKGIFAPNMGLLEEVELDKIEDEKEKAEAKKKLMNHTVETYMFVHKFRSAIDPSSDPKDPRPMGPQLPPTPATGGTKLFTHTAPCEVYFTEAIHGLPGPDGERGPIVGTRGHVMIFNRQMSSAHFVREIMKESNTAGRVGRATRSSNSNRNKNVGPEKASKQQRAMAANPCMESLEESSICASRQTRRSYRTATPRQGRPTHEMSTRTCRRRLARRR